jgi:hypothetical protein
MHETSLFELVLVSVTISGHMHTQKPKAADTVSHTPSYPTSHRFPASTHLQMHETSSFELVLVSVTISGRMHTRKPKAADTVSHTPSYPTSHRFPASTHLQMHEASSFELVSCFCDRFQPYGYTKTKGG